MQQNKFLVSSESLRRMFNNLGQKTKYEFEVTKNLLQCQGESVGIEAQLKDSTVFDLTYEQFERLRKILFQLTDQPILIAIDTSGWVFLKDCII